MIPVALIALAGATVAFTRLIILNQGLWEDEYYSVVHYISGGPAGIFGGWHYVPNDHMLFELLTWATTGLLRSHADAVYRLWGVVPALGAGALMTWWLWRRVGPWTAAIFAVLAAAAPNYFALSSQARGYGLGFLAGVMVTIGGDALLWRRSRGALALFAGGALVGILTLPDFVLPFLALAGMVGFKRSLRGTMVRTVAAVGVLSLAWYAPVLSGLLSSSNQQFGARLAWYGFVVGPVKDQTAPLLVLLFPSLSLWRAVAIALVLIAIGVVALWRVPDRLLALLLVLPALFSYLVLELSRRFVEDRFLSFVALPLLAIAAIGLVAIGRACARRPPLTALVVAAAVCASLLVLGKTMRYGSEQAQVPLEASREVAAMITGTRPELPVLSNSQRTLGFEYYLHFHKPIQVQSNASLVRLFCSRSGAFLYIDDTNHSTRADTTCLSKRGAFEVQLPEQTNSLSLWFVPSASPNAAQPGRGSGA